MTPIEYQDFTPAERARILRNERRGIESQIATLEAGQLAGRKIDENQLTALEGHHDELTKKIDKLEQESALERGGS